MESSEREAGAAADAAGGPAGVDVAGPATSVEGSGCAESPSAREPWSIALGFARLPGWRGELLILAGLVLAACLLTWPLVVTLDLASGARGDYFNNLWNAWWVEHCLTSGESPYWTDYFY